MPGLGRLARLGVHSGMLFAELGAAHCLAPSADAKLRRRGSESPLVRCKRGGLVSSCWSASAKAPGRFVERARHNPHLVRTQLTAALQRLCSALPCAYIARYPEPLPRRFHDHVTGAKLRLERASAEGDSSS